MKLLELLNGVKYEVEGGSLKREINNIQYDSRKILEGDMFVCLKGFEVDGHEYAQKAVDLGAKVIVCEDDVEVKG